MGLNGVIAKIEVRRGEILHKNITSTGECKECKKGKREKTSSNEVGFLITEHYTCKNTEDCNLVSNASFTIDHT